MELIGGRSERYWRTVGDFYTVLKEEPRELDHAIRVCYNVHRIGAIIGGIDPDKYHGDPLMDEQLELAALGHDIGKWKVPKPNNMKNGMEKSFWRQEMKSVSATMASDFMERHGYPEEAVTDVMVLISSSDERYSLRAERLHDADILDLICKLEDPQWYDHWDIGDKTEKIMKYVPKLMTPSVQLLKRHIFRNPELSHVMKTGLCI